MFGLFPEMKIPLAKPSELPTISTHLALAWVSAKGKPCTRRWKRSTFYSISEVCHSIHAIFSELRSYFVNTSVKSQL